MEKVPFATKLTGQNRDGLLSLSQREGQSQTYLVNKAIENYLRARNALINKRAKSGDKN